METKTHIHTTEFYVEIQNKGLMILNFGLHWAIILLTLAICIIFPITLHDCWPYLDLFHTFIKNVHFCFAMFLLGLAQSYGSLLIAKVILTCVQDFEAILAWSATETYGPIFILSYETSVLYKACFPEAVNLMRHCLFYNIFLLQNFGSGKPV